MNSRAAAVTAASAMSLLCAVAAAAPIDGTTADAGSGSVSSWEPRYTSFLVLSDTEDLISLALDRETLWLATERFVTHLSGGVWAEPTQIADSASVFALAPAPSASQPTDDIWAFGFAGGAWHGLRGQWADVQTDTSADFYSAVARRGDDVWAAGFDYDTEYGTLLHYDGSELLASTHEWLYRQLLLAIAMDSTGELWSGGCDGNEGAFMMRDWGQGHWEPVELPPISGCIEHLSFSQDGRGMAAADTDILWWDGEAWQAFGQDPPEGFSWVRVAVSDPAFDGVDVSQSDLPFTGYAVPGIPTWRGYIDGQTPWRFDSMAWTETAVDYRGYDWLFLPGDANPAAQGFLDLVSDGESTLSISRSGGPRGLARQAAVMSISASEARLSHPLLLTLRSDTTSELGGGAVIAAAPGGDIWAGGSLGAAGPPGPAPFLRGDGAVWSIAPGSVFDGADPFRIRSIDLAADSAGWALGRVDTRSAGQRQSAWRWDGSEWLDVTPPPYPPVNTWSSQLRALPDGRAWALGTDRWLREFSGDSWSVIPGSPLVGPVNRPQGEAEMVPLRAPFDVVAGRGGTMSGWTATSERFFSYSEPGPSFASEQSIPRGQVLDIQLIDESHGWAIARDSAPDGGAGQTPGVLLRLDGRRWREVDMRGAVRELEQATRSSGSSPGGRNVDAGRLRWQLMSVVSADEAWLFGTMPEVSQREQLPFLMQVRQVGAAGAVQPRLFLNCEINDFDAVTADGGTDVWIMGRSSCGPVAEAVQPEYAGPISLLRVRDVAGTIFIPTARVGEP